MREPSSAGAEKEPAFSMAWDGRWEMGEDGRFGVNEVGCFDCHESCVQSLPPILSAIVYFAIVLLR